MDSTATLVLLYFTTKQKDISIVGYLSGINLSSCRNLPLDTTFHLFFSCIVIHLNAQEETGVPLH